MLAIKHYNEGSHPLNPTPGLTVGGKTYKLTTVVYDHKYTTEGGVTSANKLVFDDGAKFVLGTWGSAPSISAAETVFEPNKILFATTGWSQKCIGPDKPYTFRLHMTGLQYNGAFYDYAAVNLPDKKKLAILAANDESGFAVAKDLHQIADRLGLEIVAEEFHDRGTPDMYPFLTRILAAEPDILDTGGGVPGDEALIMKQLHELGADIIVSGAGAGPGRSPGHRRQGGGRGRLPRADHQLRHRGRHHHRPAEEVRVGLHCDLRRAGGAVPGREGL